MARIREAGGRRYINDGTTVIAAPLATAQNAAMFCLQPETFGPFLEWLKREHGDQLPAEWFEPALVREDLRAAVDFLATAIEAMNSAVIIAPPLASET